jgi:hypothetical protein
MQQEGQYSATIFFIMLTLANLPIYHWNTVLFLSTPVLSTRIEMYKLLYDSILNLERYVQIQQQQH